MKRAGRSPVRPNKQSSARLLQSGDTASGRRDLLGGCGGEGVRGHVQLKATEVTRAEDLDRSAVADGPCVDQIVGPNLAAGREELGQLRHVDDLEFDPERILEALE